MSTRSGVYDGDIWETGEKDEGRTRGAVKQGNMHTFLEAEIGCQTEKASSTPVSESQQGLQQWIIMVNSNTGNKTILSLWD